jgi:hypothetical protein
VIHSHLAGMYTKLHNLDQAVKHARPWVEIYSLGGDQSLLKICEETLDELLSIHDYLANNKKWR